MKISKSDKIKTRNLVAKHSWQINKPKVFKNKKKDYQRHPKHKNKSWDFSCCSFN